MRRLGTARRFHLVSTENAVANTMPFASDVEAETRKDSIVFITLTSTDTEDGGDLATTFTLTDPPNSPPVAQDDAPNGIGTPVVANPAAPPVTFVSPASVLANDSDPDAGETALLRVTAAGVPEQTQVAVPPGVETAVAGTYGTLTIKPEGSYVYKLDSARAATMGLAAGVQATERFVYAAANNGGGAGNQDAATLSIIVQGANDAPHDISISSARVDENVPIGTVVGTLAAFDPDGDPITWTLTDSAGGRFALDPNTGVLTVADDGLFPINYERQQSYTIGVTASDGTLSGARQLTISVNDIDEAPILFFLQDKLPVPIPENVLAAPTLYYTLTVRDDALGSWTIALSGAQANLFHLAQLSATVYQLWFDGGVVPDYETLQSYSVSVDVDDPAMGDGPEVRFSVTIPVANVQELATTSSVTITVDEDTRRVLTSADFPYNDPDGVDMAAVEILSVPAKGKLYYDPTAGSPSDAIILTGRTTVTKAALDAGQLWYVANADEYGPAYASLLFQVADGGWLTNMATMSFAVNPVNDAPAWSAVPSFVPYHEGKTIAFAPQVSVSDPELAALNGGLGDYSFSIFTLQRSSGAVVEDVFDLDTTGTSFFLLGNSLWTQDGPFGTFSSFMGRAHISFAGGTPIPTTALVQEVLRHITYRNSSQNPSGEIDFRWEFNDGNFGDQGSGGPRSSVATTQVDFSPENDPPVNSVPGTQFAAKDTELTFSAGGDNAITITDIDAGDGAIRVTLRVDHGTLTLASTAGLATLKGNGTATIDLSGALAQVNAALEGLIYRPAAGYVGSDTLRIRTDDAGNTGDGDGVDEDAVAIYVAPVDHPTVAADDSGDVGEDVPGIFHVLGNDSDVDGPLAVLAVDGTTIAVGNTAAVAHGSVTLNADGTLTFTPAENFNGATSFSYQTRELLHYQFFDRDVATGFTSVANIPTTGGVEGFASGFDVAALAQQLSGNTDYFGIRYTGSIHAAAGGSYTFYTTSDDGSALYIDGVLVVNNDFSQGATERSGAVTLAAGTHAIEIRYFEGGGGEALQVHVSGPDTAGVKTALLESALVGSATANVAVNVLALNDAPELANLGDTTVALEQTAVRLDPDVVVSDAELDALNGGAGLYTGATFTIARTGAAVPEDVFGFDFTGALFAVSGSELEFAGATFATLDNADGALTITFTSAETAATTALVNDLLRHITYANASDAPPGQVALEYAFSDGNVAGEQGSGDPASAIGLKIIDIAPVDDPTIVADDSASTNENSAAFITVLDNDSDPDAPLVIRAINGTPIAINGTVIVANGKVSLSGDGTLVYEPSFGFHDSTSFTYQAGTGLHYQFFDREFENDFDSVAQIPTAGGIGGTATDFDVTTLAQNLSGSTDSFGIRYTGAINVATGGSYTFYTTSDDGSALYIDDVLVVSNDFSQGERSSTVTLAAGTHAIEIRYFENGGGEQLQIQVSGPDTANVRAALLDSALMTWTATVNVDVAPVNDPPVLYSISPFINALEQTGLIINGSITVFDTDLDPLNSGNGLYTGASLTLARQGGANAEDTFLLDPGGALFTLDGHDIKSGGAIFAIFDNDGGTLTIDFTSAETAATTALVNDVIRRIVYRNESDTPSGPVTLLYTFDDGSPGNGQGGGQPATATATTTVNVAPIDDFTVVQDDAVRTAEDTPIVIDVLANDSDTDTALSVVEIDEKPIAVGETVAVAHGSVTLNDDGTLTFAPASNFNGETGFTYMLNTVATATVTVTVDPADDPTVVGGDLHAVVGEGDIVTLTTADLTATDPDVPDQQLVYTVTGVAHGSVMVNGAQADTFTQADLAAGNVRFQHDAGEDDGSIALSLKGGGGAAQIVSVAIEVDPHGNDAPVAQEGAVSGDEDTPISGAALALDVDNGPGELTYSLVGENGGALHGSIVMNADGTFVYTPAAEFSGMDMITFRAVDAGGVESNTAVIGITVNPVADAPDGGFEGAPLAYVENQGPVAIDTTLTVSDPDSLDLVGATVAITAGQTADDVLGVVNQNGISGSYDATSGVLTLIGVSSLANYQAALRSVTFDNASDNPSTVARTISFRVDDGGGLADLGDATVTFTAVNDAPLNTMPAAYDVEANTDAPLAGLSIADVDASSGTLTATLSVGHGTLTAAAVGGVAVDGSGSDNVTITGTLVQINALLAAAGSVVYRGAEDFFGDDTLTLTTSDGGNTGSGGALIDSDQATIQVNTWLTGTPDADSFAVLPGNLRIDAFGGNDTITFDFRLVDATVTYRGNAVIIDGPSSHAVLTGFQKYVFTDGTVDNDDGNALVDDLFYYSHNHDVWNAQVDAEAHYNAFGWHEGRDSSAFFSTVLYLSANADVQAAGLNPLVHFDQIGWQEGRVPSLSFDLQQYLAHNADVAAAHVDPLAHFLQFGGDEGRQPFAPSELIAGNGFDYVYYLARNPDVAAAHVDPLWHFRTVGWKEGRNPNALFDTAGYLATYADIAASGVNPLDHYHQFGWLEGRDPSVGFDTTAYLAANPDVAAAHVDPLTHFLRFGIHEGRSAQADGLWG
jgi:VCBS repeat-containing protein